MSGGAGHDHAGAERSRDRRALRRALAIAACLLAIEVVGGIASGSLALLADAGHLATDMASLALALFALHLADREPTPSKTFGYRRTEILAALVNGTALGVVAVFIALEAVGRLSSPPDVRSGLLLLVASAGLAANLYAGAMLFEGREHSLNLRGRPSCTSCPTHSARSAPWARASRFSSSAGVWPTRSLRSGSPPSSWSLLGAWCANPSTS